MASKKKNKFIRRITAIVFFVSLCAFCYVYVKQETVLSQQKKQMAQIQEENARLEEEYQAKLKSVEDKNTLDYIDKYMRSHFGMVKEGEVRIDIAEDDG